MLDGLSNTAFVSERLIAGPLGTDIRRDPLLLPPTFPESVTPACVAMNRTSPGSSRTSIWAPLGTRWLSGVLSQSVYYHFLPPNCAWRDCDPEDGAGFALVSARSAHFGGVHVAFGDGACRRISSQVDLATWRAFATRSGGDAITRFE
ncbi:MAG: DUF1559 domain-containing protein [Planctomycetes bacterium]|nr:DUF1559 domain-containing protein [Planctomycetota bacterium]